jgi:hypothetical protein
MRRFVLTAGRADFVLHPGVDFVIQPDRARRETSPVSAPRFLRRDDAHAPKGGARRRPTELNSSASEPVPVRDRRSSLRAWATRRRGGETAGSKVFCGS